MAVQLLAPCARARSVHVGLGTQRTSLPARGLPHGQPQSRAIGVQIGRPHSGVHCVRPRAGLRRSRASRLTIETHIWFCSQELSWTSGLRSALAVTDDLWRVVVMLSARREFDRLPISVAAAALETLDAVAGNPQRSGKPQPPTLTEAPTACELSARACMVAAGGDARGGSRAGQRYERSPVREGRLCYAVAHGDRGT